MTDSALVPAGHSPASLTSNQILSGLRTVKSVLAPDLSDDELKLFSMVAARSGLDPFAKQVYAVKRKGRVTFQTGIDGYRSIAARTGMYDGQDEPEYGPWVEAPFGHPESATVRVYRKGVTRAIAATAFWDEYKPADNDFMWQRMPRVMIAKVAEALALRKAFPYDPERREGIGADLYTADEMAQAGQPEPASVQPTARERVAARAAAVVQPVATSDEPVVDEIPGEFQEAPSPPVVAEGLALDAFRDLCARGGKSTVAIAKVIETTADHVGPRVKAMTDVERGVLATELGLEWRP